MLVYISIYTYLSFILQKLIAVVLHATIFLHTHAEENGIITHIYLDTQIKLYLSSIPQPERYV